MTGKPPVRVGDLLRKARLATGISQLELALRLGVSQRHVSFVERGRSRAGRELLMAWLDELAAPRPVRNAITLHAGYTPLPTQSAPSGSAVELHDADLQRVVDVYNPFPAFLFDADWHVTTLNDGGLWLCRVLMPDYLATLPDQRAGMDMIHAMTSPYGLFSRMNNASVAAAALLHQLRAEEWARPALQQRVDDYEKSVKARFAIDIEAVRPMVDRAAVMLKFDFTTDLGWLSFYTVQSAVGLPQNITLDSPRVELWFPGDEQTRETVLSVVA